MKLSSEDAGGVSLTSVVWREMPLGELVGLMLDVAGKDVARVHEILLRGALVAGATRYRWDAIDAAPGDLGMLLASLPDADPLRPFAPERCIQVRLEGTGLRTDLSREALARRRFLRRRSFWDALLEAVALAGARYAGYSYREKADRYIVEIAPFLSDTIRSNAGLLRYSSLEALVRQGALRRVEFLVARGSG